MKTSCEFPVKDRYECGKDARYQLFDRALKIRLDFCYEHLQAYSEEMEEPPST